MSSIIYGITAVVALALVIGYLVSVKKKDTWLFLLFISVLLVNVGYFSISVSRILEEALLANRVSYLGSVFLPLCMFMSLADICRIRIPKGVTAVLLCISAAVFILAASPGYCDLYYKEVTLEIIDGTARLVKIYGKYHIIYFFYLFTYFASMLAMVAFVIIKKKITSHKYASLLISVVFLNILIWLLEQLISVDFEFLSISYIVSETMLLFLFSIMKDFDALKNEKTEAEKEAAQLSTQAPADNTAPTQTQEDNLVLSEQLEDIIALWQPSEALTSREIEVLTLLLDNCKRKEIAERLCLSENTVKTHTSHIFNKLSVKDRSELIEKANGILLSK
ncbi:MAG: hypothetical protein IJE93_09260 [Clostridia bacterium]|nr:hypothetical protein [Clostridia bacterium]MBQ3161659.1 hypothetical protein [Oscillospiraceae bacterium]